MNMFNLLLLIISSSQIFADELCPPRGIGFGGCPKEAPFCSGSCIQSSPRGPYKCLGDCVDHESGFSDDDLEVSRVSGNVLPRSVRSNDVNKGPFGSVRQVPCLDPFSNLSSTEANTINLYSQIIPEFEFPICAGIQFKPANDETTSCGMMTANYSSISTAAGLPIITGECCVSDVIGFTRTERITYMRFSLNKPNINMPKNGTINVGQTAECGATENDGVLFRATPDIETYGPCCLRNYFDAWTTAKEDIAYINFLWECQGTEASSRLVRTTLNTKVF